jgi:hypothetical protein
MMVRVPGIVFVILLAWELTWLALLLSQGYCTSGNCVIGKNLVTSYYATSMLLMILIYTQRSRLRFPENWETILFVVMMLHVFWTLEALGEEAVAGSIPTNEVALDNGIMVLALIMACIWWFFYVLDHKPRKSIERPTHDCN